MQCHMRMVRCVALRCCATLCGCSFGVNEPGFRNLNFWCFVNSYVTCIINREWLNTLPMRMQSLLSGMKEHMQT